MKKYILPIFSSVMLISSIVINLKPTEYKSTTKTTDSLINYNENKVTSNTDSNDTEEYTSSAIGENVFLTNKTPSSNNTSEYNNEVDIINNEVPVIEPNEELINDNEIIQNKEEIIEPTPEETTPIIDDNKETFKQGLYQISTEENYLKLNDNDIWNIEVLEDDTYNISSIIDNNYLEALDIKVSLKPKDDLINQKWTITKKDNYYQIISKNNNKCLSISNEYIKVKKCNDELQEQKLTITPKEVSNLENNKYKIRTYSDNKELSLSDNKITLSDTENSKNNIWYLNKQDNSEYSIISSTSNRLIINNDLSISNQNDTWKIILNTDNTYIISKDNLCLTNNLIKEECNGSNNQKFIIEKYNDKLYYKGIDISSYQGNIDWEALAQSEVEFVIIRAGYGDNWTSQDDEKLIDNVSNCEKYNIPYGIYLYSYATKINGSNEININSESVSSEVAHILRLLDNLKSLGYTPNIKTKVFYDMEDPSTINLGKETLTSIADNFCQTLEENGYNCGIYANKYFYTQNLDYNYLKNKYDIWYAYWPSNINTYEEALENINNEIDYNIWQFSSNGQIAGINTKVDLNIGIDIFN